jgi:hypothetical protein
MEEPHHLGHPIRVSLRIGSIDEAQAYYVMVNVCVDSAEVDDRSQYGYELDTFY